MLVQRSTTVKNMETVAVMEANRVVRTLSSSEMGKAIVARWTWVCEVCGMVHLGTLPASCDCCGLSTSLILQHDTRQEIGRRW